MRITNSMLSSRALMDLQANYAAMARAQEQVSSGKRLNRPSDNPSDVQQSIKLSDTLASITQYLRNIDSAQRMTSTSETALSSATDAVQRLKELAVQTASGTLTASDRAGALEEVKQLSDQLVSLANTKVDGNYVFSGQKTATPAYASAAAAYAGDAGAINARISPGVTVQVNTTADVAFGPALAAVNQFAADLASGNPTQPATLAALDTGLAAMVSARTRIGAVDNRLTEAQTFLTGTQTATTSMLSQLEDADMASAITDAASRQATYQAAIAVNARILQKSLIDEL